MNKIIMTTMAVCAICAWPCRLFSAEGPKNTLPESFLPSSCRGGSRALSISEGIAMVSANSRLVRISLPDKEMAFADTLIARSALFPRLSANASKSFYRYQPAAKLNGAAVITAEKQPFSFGLDLYQTLYDFGKSLAYYQASKEIYNASSANLESVRRMAVLEFIAAYFDLLQAEKMIAVAEKEAESLSSYLSDVQHLYDQGVVVQNDLLPAKVRLADAKQRLIAARNGREIAAAALNNMLALPLAGALAVRDIEMRPPDLPGIEEAWRIAEGQRPEIAFLDNVLKASMFGEKARARENFPVIFAQGDYNRAQNKYQVHEDNMVVQLGAKINLYEGGADRAELLKARGRLAQLKEQRQKLLDDIRFEIENSYVGLRNAGEKVTVAKDALSQADENVRAARARYAEGAATATEVLEAIALQTGSQTNFFSADYELKRTYARLMYSLGIDLSLVYERIERGHHGNPG